MGTLYKFSKEAYWYRVAGPSSGPLITPLYSEMKKGDKERLYGDDFIAYLKRINPDPKSIKLILSPTYGPSKGIMKKNGLLRFIMAVYPGPRVENQVMIKEIIGNWGVVEGLPEDRIPAMNITHASHPWLIHKVYGSNKKFSAVKLRHDILVPVMSDGRFIQMKFLERI